MWRCEESQTNFLVLFIPFTCLSNLITLLMHLRGSGWPLREMQLGQAITDLGNQSLPVCRKLGLLESGKE